jgi:RimJ/RimL family protein N-acetyltransferase
VLVAIALRPFADSDLDPLFLWERDPRAVQMAAFTRPDPADRGAFDAHYERVRSDPSNTLLAIESTRSLYGRVAGHDAASAKVLARAGFVEVASETSFAPGIGAEVVERIYRLDR